MTNHDCDVDKLLIGFRMATMVPRSMHSQLSGAFSTFAGGGAKLSIDDSLLGVIDNAVLALCGDRIVWIAPNSELPNIIRRCASKHIEVIEGNGDWLTPGLIDCHTHLVFGGNRASEWQARLRGATYAELAKAGGGILSTVAKTRESSVEDLLKSAKRRLKQFIREGVTTIEIKSGYGLDLETELKQLQVARLIACDNEISVETTLLAAHAVPPEYHGRRDQYVDWVCSEMIPAARGLCTAVDAFCESIAFDLKQTEKVFRSALDNGFQIKIHAEQLSYSGSAAMAASMGAISADHLEYLSDADCTILAQNNTVATLLPGAFYCLKEKRVPPIHALREAKATMAVASDCNPGSSPMCSILLAANMACNLFGLTVDEAWLGITRHAAMALNAGHDRGMLFPGMRADVARWQVENLAEVIYSLGGAECHSVYVGGKLRSEVV